MKTASTDILLNGPTDFEKISDKDLYDYCKKVGFNARKWHRRFIATIPEVAKRRLFKKYGYCSIHEFAAKMAGVSHNNTDEVLRVNEKFKELPKMKALIGEVGFSKLKIVACIATKETDGFWAEKVKNMTKQVLEIYVREIKRKEATYRVSEFEVNGNNKGSMILQPTIVKNNNFSQKFPGELSTENLRNPQQQEQINMFDSEKLMSQNANQARLENIQNHDKKTFTIQIDEETEFELRKFKQLLEKERKEPIDWNSALKEIVKRATAKQTIKSEKTLKKEFNSNKQNFHGESQQIVKPAPASEPSTKPISRYIPARIKHELKQKYQGHCAYKGCNKPAEQIHHKDGFSLTKKHENLIPLCKTHHDFVHQLGIKPAFCNINRIFKMYKTENIAASG